MIVCEIGQNWVGSMNLAKHLIYMAQKNDADLVKFQLYDTDNDVPLSSYPKDSELYHLAKEAELNKEQALELFKYGEDLGIEVFFSVFDVERIRWCEEIGVKRYKIARKCNDNDEILLAIKETGKPLIISVKEWGEAAMTINCKLLYCISDYPTPLDRLKLSDVSFDVIFQGISDHTIGMDCAKIALARGAEIVEKHFAIDHRMGVDAPWSMTPNQLIELKKFENKVKKAL